jgi:hypothetical protein
MQGVHPVPHRKEVTRSVGDGPVRTFFVTFTDDSPERSEAVKFFSELTRPIFPASHLPDHIDYLSIDDAQAYLDTNPIEQRWSLLRILSEDRVADNELYRLQFVPELDHLLLYDVGNEAISHTVHLHSLRTLVVYSDRITDECLQFVRRLTSLESIDFQSSPQISQKAFTKTISVLPKIVDAYPPFVLPSGQRS